MTLYQLTYGPPEHDPVPRTLLKSRSEPALFGLQVVLISIVSMRDVRPLVHRMSGRAGGSDAEASNRSDKLRL